MFKIIEAIGKSLEFSDNKILNPRYFDMTDYICQSQKSIGQTDYKLISHSKDTAIFKVYLIK